VNATALVAAHMPSSRRSRSPSCEATITRNSNNTAAEASPAASLWPCRRSSCSAASDNRVADSHRDRASGEFSLDSSGCSLGGGGVVGLLAAAKCRADLLLG